MASAFEINTLAEIGVLNVMIDRILIHLAKSSPNPGLFLAKELELGLESLAKTNYWSVSHKNQNDVLAAAKARYTDRIRSIQARQ